MNFLAHFHLAWPGLVAGGLEGDYYKGPLRGELHPDIERGVKLHRAIDSYTDSHPLTGALREQFPGGLRRYAGIVIDIAFDHYLTIHWRRFHPHPLAEFNRAVYAVLAGQESHLSPGSRNMLRRLLEHDILNAYHTWETVPATVSRVGERFRHNPFAEIGRQLEPLREPMEATFLKFYPQLQKFSRQWDADHAPAADGFALQPKTP